MQYGCPPHTHTHTQLKRKTKKSSDIKALAIKAAFLPVFHLPLRPILDHVTTQKLLIFLDGDFSDIKCCTDRSEPAARFKQCEAKSYLWSMKIRCQFVAQWPKCGNGDPAEKKRGTHKLHASWIPFHEFVFFQQGVVRRCTVPGGTAIPGRCVEWTEQAPVPSPRFKNQFNIWSPGRGRIRY